MDKNGTIDYTEFIAATMHRHKLQKEEDLLKAFLYFDNDGSGSVNALSLSLNNGIYISC